MLRDTDLLPCSIHPYCVHHSFANEIVNSTDGNPETDPVQEASADLVKCGTKEAHHLIPLTLALTGPPPPTPYRERSRFPAGPVERAVRRDASVATNQQ